MVAIVLRVDSGGGDVLASDLMYRAVLEAKKRKPVIASMGDVAASGGYYVAMGADEILADPTTITGSIGVFYLKPALKGLLGDKLGVNRESISRAPLADLMDPWRPWTPEEQTAVQAWVDATYDDFITYVAEARKLDKEKVDAIARGRVWSGQDAHARGLVDQLGGFARGGRGGTHAGQGGPRRGAGPGRLRRAEGPALRAGRGAERAERPAASSRAPALPPGLQALLRESGLTTGWLEPGMKAQLPFTVHGAVSSLGDTTGAKFSRPPVGLC